jgi:hypothetical protein
MMIVGGAPDWTTGETGTADRPGPSPGSSPSIISLIAGQTHIWPIGDIASAGNDQTPFK